MDDSKAKNPQLEDSIYEEICKLSKTGNDLLEKNQYLEAVEVYHKAFDLIPEPFEIYQASTWLLAAVGETYFLMEEYNNALHALEEAMYCPKAIGNPFIHLRLGQTFFELGNFDQARDELARAYMGGGREIFKSEDPKYYKHIKTYMKGLK